MSGKTITAAIYKLQPDIRYVLHNFSAPSNTKITTHTTPFEARPDAIARRRRRRRRRARSTSASASRANTHRVTASRVSHSLAPPVSTTTRRHSSRDGSTPNSGHFTCFRRDARETTRETARTRVAIDPRMRRRVARVRTRARAIGRVGRLKRRRRARRSAIASAARRRERLERMSLRMSIVGLRRVDAMNDRTGRTRGRKGETRRSTRG